MVVRCARGVSRAGGWKCRQNSDRSGRIPLVGWTSTTHATPRQRRERALLAVSGSGERVASSAFSWDVLGAGK